MGGVQKTLGLASAGIFCKEGAAFRRASIAGGWDEQGIKTLEPDEPLQRGLNARRPSAITSHVAKRLPSAGRTDLIHPVLGLPDRQSFRRLRPSVRMERMRAGNDLDHDERATLAALCELGGRSLDTARLRIAAPTDRGIGEQNSIRRNQIWRAARKIFARRQPEGKNTRLKSPDITRQAAGGTVRPRPSPGRRPLRRPLPIRRRHKREPKPL